MTTVYGSHGEVHVHTRNVDKQTDEDRKFGPGML